MALRKPSLASSIDGCACVPVERFPQPAQAFLAHSAQLTGDGFPLSLVECAIARDETGDHYGGQEGREQQDA